MSVQGFSGPAIIKNAQVVNARLLFEWSNLIWLFLFASRRRKDRPDLVRLTKYNSANNAPYRPNKLRLAHDTNVNLPILLKHYYHLH